MARFAQKPGPKNEAPSEREQRRLVAAAIEAKESGELRRSDALFSQAFDIYFDRSIAEQRAFVRLMLGDSSGYCSDLEFFADRDEEKLHKQFETACVTRDTLPFIHSGLAASRFPDVSTVQRVTKRSDGRTEYTMLDKDGDMKIRISTALGDTIFMLCDEMPQFQGGEREMYKFFGKNMKYPTAALYHFALQIHPKMRRYFSRQRDETFAGRPDTYRDEEVVASAGRRTGRPPRRSNAEKEQVDRVDLYCELVLPYEQRVVKP